jgi:hypothetical protein
MLEIIPSIGKSTAGFENQTADFKILRPIIGNRLFKFKILWHILSY